MTVTVRFAPSPTGRIHIGNARTALFNWLFALNNKGRFIQRFDDTDIARSKQEFADAILYDLHWLGIFPDATEYFKLKRDSRVLTLSFTFRFGNTYKVNRHQDGASEEKERVQNG